MWLLAAAVRGGRGCAWLPGRVNRVTLKHRPGPARANCARPGLPRSGLLPRGERSAAARLTAFAFAPLCPTAGLGPSGLAAESPKAFAITATVDAGDGSAPEALTWAFGRPAWVAPTGENTGASNQFQDFQQFEDSTKLSRSISSAAQQSLTQRRSKRTAGSTDSPGQQQASHHSFCSIHGLNRRTALAVPCQRTP